MKSILLSGVVLEWPARRMGVVPFCVAVASDGSRTNIRIGKLPSKHPDHEASVKRAQKLEEEFTALIERNVGVNLTVNPYNWQFADKSGIIYYAVSVEEVIQSG